MDRREAAPRGAVDGPEVVMKRRIIAAAAVLALTACQDAETAGPLAPRDAVLASDQGDGPGIGAFSGLRPLGPVMAAGPVPGAAFQPVGTIALPGGIVDIIETRDPSRSYVIGFGSFAGVPQAFIAVPDLSFGLPLSDILPTAGNSHGVIIGTGLLGEGVYKPGDGAVSPLPVPPFPGAVARPLAVGRGRHPAIFGSLEMAALSLFLPTRWNYDEGAGEYVASPLPSTGNGTVHAVDELHGVAVGDAGGRAVIWDLATYTGTDAGFAGTLLDVNRRTMIGVNDEGNGMIGTPGNWTVVPGFIPQRIAPNGHVLGMRIIGDEYIAALRIPTGQVFELSEFPPDFGVVGAISDNLLSVASTEAVSTMTYDRTDDDGDRVANGFDNCPDYSNRSQVDVNENLIGDHCEAPSVSVNVTPADGRTGRLFHFTGTGTDLLGRRLEYTWTMSDGTVYTSRVARHRFEVDGTQGGMLSVSNGIASAQAVITVEVSNRPPDVVVNAVATYSAGVQFDLEFTITDEVADNPFEWVVKWLDGTTSSGTCVAAAPCVVNTSHTYASAAAPLNIAIEVTDKDGATRRQRHQISPAD